MSLSLRLSEAALWGKNMSIWVNGREKKVLSMHTYRRVKCTAWAGLGPRAALLEGGWAWGGRLHVYLQGPRSEYGWERPILHQRLGARGLPGVGGTTLHVSPHLTPSQNRQGGRVGGGGVRGWRTLYNRRLLHHNWPRAFPSRPALFMFRPELMLLAVVSDDTS